MDYALILKLELVGLDQLDARKKKEREREIRGGSRDRTMELLSTYMPVGGTDM